MNPDPEVEAARVRLELFGGMRILGPAGEIRYRSEKTRLVAAYLALRQHVVSRASPRKIGLSRERLLVDIWGPDASDSERDALNTELWWLRRELRTSGAGGEVILGSDVLSLDPHCISLDVAEFDLALDRAAGCRDGAGTVALLAPAFRLYSGRLLAGLDPDWCLDEQERLRHAYWEICDRLCASHAASGEVEAGLRLTSRWLVEDPLAERAVEWQIRLYALAGRSTAARATYARFTTRLLAECGEEPGDHLRSVLSTAERGARWPVPREATVLPVSRGGPLSPASDSYIERVADAEVQSAIASGEGLILLKGPGESGKSSLLFRAMLRSQARGWECVRSDSNALAGEFSLGIDAALSALVAEISSESEASNASGSPGVRLRRALEARLSSPGRPRLLWILDGLDVLMSCPHAEAVFRVLRSLHVAGRADPGGPLARLTMILAYASEPHLYVRNLAASPFSNVGVHVTLAGFSESETGQVLQQLNPGIAPAEVAAVHRLVGGRPGLVQRAGRELSRRGCSADELRRQALRLPGLFYDHLRPLVEWLEQDSSLRSALHSLQRDRSTLDHESFYRLRSAGLVNGDHPGDARVSSRLYEALIQEYLDPDPVLPGP